MNILLYFIIKNHYERNTITKNTNTININTYSKTSNPCSKTSCCRTYSRRKARDAEAVPSCNEISSTASESFIIVCTYAMKSLY